MAWDRIRIQLENGAWADAQAPIIISASRSTDIPAFYSDWFFHRLREGYSAWTNPFNGVQNYVSYANTRFIVFWSKNPKPLLAYIDQLAERNIGCYVQFTLNDYQNDGLENGVPPLAERIETFKRLVDKLGRGHVVWRFDPLVLTDKITINDLLIKIENVGTYLNGFTEKLVFSFADIATYKKVRLNLEKNNINYTNWEEYPMGQFAAELENLNKKWGYQLASCGEKIDLEQFGISHNSCVDDDLIIRFGYTDKVLMDFLGVKIKDIENEVINDIKIQQNVILLPNKLYAVKKKNNKDKGQRKACKCAISKDIGQYNTCPHLCEYCYANSSKQKALDCYSKHRQNKLGETIM